MTDKAIIPKPIADAIEGARNHGLTDETILRTTLDRNDAWVTPPARPLNEVDPMLLAKALVNGYEVERTPHERLRERVDALDEIYATETDVDTKKAINAEIYGITTTLEILGITVEGINA